MNLPRKRFLRLIIATQGAVRAHFMLQRNDSFPNKKSILWIKDYRTTDSTIKRNPSGRTRSAQTPEIFLSMRPSIIVQSSRHSARKHVSDQSEKMVRPVPDGATITTCLSSLALHKLLFIKKHNKSDGLNIGLLDEKRQKVKGTEAFLIRKLICVVKQGFLNCDSDYKRYFYIMKLLRIYVQRLFKEFLA